MIDVVIPCRNAPSVLSLTLAHLWAYANPTGLVSSITLLDNCSTDEGMDHLLRYVATLPRHTVIQHEENIGAWCSINRGLALARNRFVLVVTSDALLGPHTLAHLLDAQKRSDAAFIGPDGVIGMQHYWATLIPPAQTTLECDGRYNGACWLMDWERLQNTVGWFDPRFYVCYGDTDYVERLKLYATEHDDSRFRPWHVGGLYICHLDKQTRRHDMTATQDSETEIRDGEAFHAKWRDFPAILAKHPRQTVAFLTQRKGWEHGGWNEAKVG